MLVKNPTPSQKNLNNNNIHTPCPKEKRKKKKNGNRKDINKLVQYIALTYEASILKLLEHVAWLKTIMASWWLHISYVYTHTLSLILLSSILSFTNWLHLTMFALWKRSNCLIMEFTQKHTHEYEWKPQHKKQQQRNSSSSTNTQIEQSRMKDNLCV